MLVYSDVLARLHYVYMLQDMHIMLDGGNDGSRSNVYDLISFHIVRQQEMVAAGHTVLFTITTHSCFPAVNMF